MSDAKPKKLSIPLDQPTRGSVEKLFNSLSSVRDLASKEHKAYQDADKALDDLQDKFEASAEYKRLDKAREAAYKAFREREDELVEMKRRVRNHFLAKGLTPEVRKMIEELVDAFEG